MPQSKFAIAWTRLGEKYGPLTWLTIPGQNILVVNSYEAAKELLEKRAVTFADRPRFTMLNEVLGKHFARLVDVRLFTNWWARGHRVERLLRVYWIQQQLEKAARVLESAPFCTGGQTRLLGSIGSESAGVS